MRMRRTVRNAWVEALRSGDYTQAQGALAPLNAPGEPVGFCCLGVLCEVAIKQGLDVEVADRVLDGGFSASAEHRTYGGADSFPPGSVAEWATGEVNPNNVWMATVPDEEFPNDPYHVSLADENDGGAPFSRIADLIENDADAADDIRDDLPAAVTA